jgi:hypothetical protein
LGNHIALPDKVPDPASEPRLEALITARGRGCCGTPSRCPLRESGSPTPSWRPGWCSPTRLLRRLVRLRRLPTCLRCSASPLILVRRRTPVPSASPRRRRPPSREGPIGVAVGQTARHDEADHIVHVLADPYRVDHLLDGDVGATGMIEDRLDAAWIRQRKRSGLVGADSFRHAPVVSHAGGEDWPHARTRVSNMGGQ